jgi:hypothetical protein
LAGGGDRNHEQRGRSTTPCFPHAVVRRTPGQREPERSCRLLFKKEHSSPSHGETAVRASCRMSVATSPGHRHGSAPPETLRRCAPECRLLHEPMCLRGAPSGLPCQHCATPLCILHGHGYASTATWITGAGLRVPREIGHLSATRRPDHAVRADASCWRCVACAPHSTGHSERHQPPGPSGGPGDEFSQVEISPGRRRSRQGVPGFDDRDSGWNGIGVSAESRRVRVVKFCRDVRGHPAGGRP